MDGCLNYGRRPVVRVKLNYFCFLTFALFSSGFSASSLSVSFVAASALCFRFQADQSPSAH